MLSSHNSLSLSLVPSPVPPPPPLEQDPTDPHCPILRELLWLMSLDSAACVREAAVVSVCMSEFTMPEVMKRARDVAPSVRAVVRTKVLSGLPVAVSNPNTTIMSDADTTTASVIDLDATNDD